MVDHQPSLIVLVLAYGEHPWETVQRGTGNSQEFDDAMEQFKAAQGERERELTTFINNITNAVT